MYQCYVPMLIVWRDQFEVDILHKQVGMDMLPFLLMVMKCIVTYEKFISRIRLKYLSTIPNTKPNKMIKFIFQSPQASFYRFYVFKSGCAYRKFHYFTIPANDSIVNDIFGIVLKYRFHKYIIIIFIQTLLVNYCIPCLSIVVYKLSTNVVITQFTKKTNSIHPHVKYSQQLQSGRLKSTANKEIV